jgi:DinB family protein
MTSALRLGMLCTVLAGPLAAQARPANDPLTGTWTGYIGRSEANPSPATFEFILAANLSVTGKVTGPQITPGEIVRGSFDRVSGALKFSVVLHDTGNNAGGEVTFDGRVSGDSGSGKLTMGNGTGVFRFARGAGKAAAKPAGPPVGDAGAALRRSFVELSGWISRSAELVPAEKYGYRPATAVRNFGQLVGHVVDGSNYYCGRAAGKSVEWSDATEKSVTSRQALLAALQQALAACQAVYDAGGSQVAPLIENIGHSSLHYGNLITYIRMLGLVPPSS